MPPGTAGLRPPCREAAVNGGEAHSRSGLPRTQVELEVDCTSDFSGLPLGPQGLEIATDWPTPRARQTPRAIPRTSEK